MPSIKTPGKTFIHFKEGDRYRSLLEGAFHNNPSKLCVVYAHEKTFQSDPYLAQVAKRVSEKKVKRNEIILYGMMERDGKPVKIVFEPGKGFVIHPFEEFEELDEQLVESTVWVRSKSDFFARVKDAHGEIVQRFTAVN